MTFKFTRAYVEHIHDVLVASRMPYDEPIDPGAFRDKDKLDSAVHRPFHTFDGHELYPSFDQKAAVLFHAIACSHAFSNGNKRTAVMTLDLFLTANSRVLLINNDDVYALSRETVEANMHGRKVDTVIAELATRIDNESMEFSDLQDPELISKVPGAPQLHQTLLRIRTLIQENPLNAAEV